MTTKTSFFVIAGGLCATTMISVWYWKRRKSYVKVAKVTKLFFYPVKSLKGIEVDRIQCTERGASVNGVRDRWFMLVGEGGALLSQRQEPSLALLAPSVSGSQLTISAEGREPLTVEIQFRVAPEDALVDCVIFTDNVRTVDCGEKAAQWFQDFLKRTDVRLVRCSPDLPDRKYAPKEQSNFPFLLKTKVEFPVHLQDLSPFHLLSQSSVDYLNTKTEKRISERNFRPNILVGEAPAFQEDMWKDVRFSSGAEMSTLLPCTRCVLTTNDPETGIKDNKEPLVSLRKFRMLKDQKLAKMLGFSPCFGNSCWLKKEGEIRVGDEVFAVLDRVIVIKDTA